MHWSERNMSLRWNCNDQSIRNDVAHICNDNSEKEHILWSTVRQLKINKVTVDLGLERHQQQNISQIRVMSSFDAKVFL